MKLINKALLYRDWKYSKWFIPILFLEIFRIIIPSFSRDEYGRIVLDIFMNKSNGLGGTVLTALTLAVMASVLFSFDRNFTSYSFSASMPFSRREIVISKWLVGFYNVFFPSFSVYVIENIILILNHNWGEHFLTITYSYIAYLLFLFCILGFILMVQSMNGTVFVGGLISIVFAAIPITIMHIIENIYMRYNEMFIVPSFIKNTREPVWLMLDFLKSLFGLDITTDESALQFLDGSVIAEVENYMSYMRYWAPAKIIIYLAAIVLMFIFSLKLFNKSRLELTGRITTVESCNKLYKAIMAFYFGFLLHTLYLAIAGSIAFRLDIVIIFCVIIPIPLYILIGRVIKIYNRRFS